MTIAQAKIHKLEPRKEMLDLIFSNKSLVIIFECLSNNFLIACL